jgi:hypothetical protein
MAKALRITSEQIDLGLGVTSRVSQPKSVEPFPQHNEPTLSQSTWKPWQKILFRIVFVFFVSMSLPNNLDWYKELFNFDWLHLHYRDLYDVARFGSGLNFFGNTIFGSNLNGYAVWIITLVFAIVGGLAWTAIANFLKKDCSEYNLLYYWLKVVVRYVQGLVSSALDLPNSLQRNSPTLPGAF